MQCLNQLLYHVPLTNTADSKFLLPHKLQAAGNEETIYVGPQAAGKEKMTMWAPRRRAKIKTIIHVGFQAADNEKATVHVGFLTTTVFTNPRIKTQMTSRLI